MKRLTNRYLRLLALSLGIAMAFASVGCNTCPPISQPVTEVVKPAPEPVAPPAPPAPPPKSACDGVEMMIRVDHPTNLATVSEEDRQKIRGIASCAVEKSAKVSVDAHADYRGSRAHNNKLSNRRAMAVSDVLVESGMRKDDVMNMSYGKSKASKTKDDEVMRGDRQTVVSIAR